MGTLLLTFILLLHTISSDAFAPSKFSSCLASYGISNYSLSTSHSYATLLDFSIRNLRFAAADIAKPVAIVLPDSRDGLGGAISCARNASLAIRVRSGGHSYEGLSYTAEGHTPFVVIDLSNLNRVQVDAGSATAWVEAGASVGEVYYAVGRASRTLAFAAGSCSTVGTGGQVAGGGFGLLSRKFGLAADNVLDAVLVASDGRALGRTAMGEDVFWAIRGGGGGSWGVVYAWRIRLVAVPERVTIFTPSRSGTVDLIAGLVHKWQYTAPRLPNEFYLSAFVPAGPSNGDGDGNYSVSFTGQVLGPKELAMSVLGREFPELGLTESELTEMSWLESAARFADLGSVEELPSRESKSKRYAKFKSDYVQVPISREDLTAILRRLSGGPRGFFQMDPYGGAMARIGSAETPFPHRADNLYSVQYNVNWEQSGAARQEEYVAWLRGFYESMAPFVSHSPRSAYVNYVDLDLGTNNWTDGAESAVSRARSWGEKYFAANFDRLVRAKTRIDPENIFSNAQSIPPMPGKINA